MLTSFPLMHDPQVTFAEAPHTAGAQPYATVRPHHEAAEVHALRRAAEPIFVRVEFHPACGQIFQALFAPVVKGGAGRAEEDEVVHIAHIARHTQHLRAKG